jgi:beta-lactamase class C
LETILTTRLTFAALLALGCTSSAFAVDATAIRAAVDKAIRPIMAEHDVPGIAVGVTVDGQALYFSYGVASKQSGKQVDENTLFELGSISKTFAATLACHARDLGKLSFDDHPGKFLPRLKGSPVDRASLLELGTYTAGGLPLQFPDDVGNNEQAIAYYRAWRPDAAPGTQRRYSNPSIGLFGYSAALALQSRFDEAVETWLLPGLGMKHSHIRVPPAALADYAWGYNKDNKPVRVTPGALDAEAYGVKSSSADMVRYLQANIDPSMLAAPMRRALECTHDGYYEVGPIVQGLGWEQYRGPVTLERVLAGTSEQMSRKPNPAKRLAPPLAAPPATFFNKTGATGGFGAYAAFVPDRKIGIVILANKNYPILARVTAAQAILEQLE